MNKTFRWLPGVSMAVLAACGSAPTRVYTLQPIAPDKSPVAYEGPPVRVAAVHFPADLDRIEIMTERPDGEMHINDLDHWAAPLSKLAQQTLSADLVGRLPAGKVAFPRLPASAGGVELRVDILRVSTRDGVHLVASWQLALDPHTDRSGVVTLPDEPRTGASGLVARSLSVLLARLADQIAADLPQAAVPP